jgi:exodeoxyribonuclease VII small subunit
MKSTKKNFEEQLSRLQEIIDILDNSDTPLEEMMKVYEEGMELTTILKDYLNKAELKVIEIGKGFDTQSEELTLI